MARKEAGGGDAGPAGRTPAEPVTPPPAEPVTPPPAGPGGQPASGPPATVGEALRRGTALLRAAGSASPRLDAEVLLGHATGLERATLLTHPERKLPPAFLAAYDEAIGRRARRCPVAYITGHKEFMSLDFEVTPAVLIPRPETELLVETAVELAKARLVAEAGQGAGTVRATPSARGGRASAESPAAAGLVLADVGTGSGAVAVSLAKLLPGSTIYATDVSAGALEVAARNASRHGVMADRGGGGVLFCRGDLLDAVPEETLCFDGVVANLPYVPDRDWEGLEPGVRLFEPPESLRGGPDGLYLLRRLISELPSRLRGGGFVCLEVGPGQADEVARLLAGPGLFAPDRVVVHRDLAGHRRVVSGFRYQVE